MKTHVLILSFALFTVSNSALAIPDEVHWNFKSPTSVTFDWRGTSAENTIRYGTASGNYTNRVIAVTPNPIPTSSAGPFWEATLSGLLKNTKYYYSIANGPEHTFRTPQLSGNADFTVYAVGDIGSTRSYPRSGAVQKIIGNVYLNGFPHFVLAVGDLSYGDVKSRLDVDQHFNDVMLWSRDAAYMPAWGNHEWDTLSTLPDDFYNYLGRFNLSGYSSPGTASIYHYFKGEDWYWFDYGHVRFIAYPQAYSSATLPDWNKQARLIMSNAQADSKIKVIATFGHSPAYSSGAQASATLKGYLDSMAKDYSKYKLNLCGHHHHYERTDPAKTGGVTHIVVGTGHSTLASFSNPKPSWSVVRTKQSGALKLRFVGNTLGTYIEGKFICAPVTSVCSQAGKVLDSFRINSL